MKEPSLAVTTNSAPRRGTHSIILCVDAAISVYFGFGRSTSDELVFWSLNRHGDGPATSLFFDGHLIGQTDFDFLGMFYIDFVLVKLLSRNQFKKIIEISSQF